MLLSLLILEVIPSSRAYRVLIQAIAIISQNLPRDVIYVAEVWEVAFGLGILLLIGDMVWDIC